MRFNRFIKAINFILTIFMLIIVLSVSAYAEENSYTADNGIVEIYCGISDTNDNFYKIKNCSGFIVSNSDAGCYVVTTAKGITISSKERKKCLKNNNLSGDTYGYNDTVKVVINGDVETSLTVIAKSTKENFSILQAENVINEKEALRIGNNVEEGETVYSLGFPDLSSDTYLQYDKSDVVRCSGIVENTNADLLNGLSYIQHTAYFQDGCSGGPLVNEEGYVVGVNDNSLSFDGYYSLNIENVRKILDNYSISYRSLDYDNIYAKYEHIYNKCKLLIESGKYTSESVEGLTKAIEEVQIIVSENPSTNDITSAISKLKVAKSQLIKNTPAIHIIIYILFGVVLALAIWLAYLLIVNWKYTNPQKVKTNKRKKKNITGDEKNITDEHTTSTPAQREHKIAILKKPDSQLLVSIDKKEFSLGSKNDEVDFAVDNRAVSRKHATIRTIDNKFYIFDENSVNGTYVNDVIVEEEGKELKSGDMIALANEPFIFEEKSFIGGEI